MEKYAGVLQAYRWYFPRQTSDKQCSRDHHTQGPSMVAKSKCKQIFWIWPIITPFFLNYCWLWLWTKLRLRQISASWTKNKRRGLLANKPRLLPSGQRGPVPGVPRDGSPVRVHHDLRGRLPARPPLRPPQQLGWDQARCSEVCLWDQVCFGYIRSCSCRLQLQIHLFHLVMHYLCSILQYCCEGKG